MYLRHTLPHFFTHVSALYINVLPKEIQVLLLCIHAPCIHVTYTLLSHIHVSIITLTCTFLSGSKCSLNLVRCEVCNEAVGTLRRASLISTNLHCDWCQWLISQEFQLLLPVSDLCVVNLSKDWGPGKKTHREHYTGLVLWGTFISLLLILPSPRRVTWM